MKMNTDRRNRLDYQLLAEALAEAFGDDPPHRPEEAKANDQPEAEKERYAA